MLDDEKFAYIQKFSISICILLGAFPIAFPDLFQFEPVLVRL